MIREEAKEEIKSLEGVEVSKGRLYLIDRIYNEFESRSCESCKFSDIDTYFTDYGKCEKGYGFLFNGNVEVVKDFCCNRWKLNELGK